MNKVEEVKKEVYNLLSNDDSGHDIDHINRVLDLSLKFCKKENANKEVVSLLALLHDVDDYKIFGLENAKNLTNAKNIMNKCFIPKEVQKQVLSSLKTIGYSKLLEGKRPNTIEGMVVSDADMCDALGVNGILRTYKYSMKNGKPFFDRNTFPCENINYSKYIKKTSDSSVCHIFEKILKLKKLMMTESGYIEACSRHEIVVDVLYHLFEEEKAFEWKEYLDSYLNINYPKKRKNKVFFRSK